MGAERVLATTGAAETDGAGVLAVVVVFTSVLADGCALASGEPDWQPVRITSVEVRAETMNRFFSCGFVADIFYV